MSHADIAEEVDSNQRAWLVSMTTTLPQDVHCSVVIMDSEGVFTNLDYLGSSGVVLSVEQRATLQSSLVLLRREHKFWRVKLWGVIRGIQKDYFIAQGVGMDELKDRKALYR